MQSASLPWQMREWAFLLLLVKRTEKLQVYLSVLRQQIAILQPKIWGELANRYNHLDGQHTCREYPKDRHRVVRTGVSWEVGLTTGISAGLKRVTPASINLIGCWSETAELFLLMSQCYMHGPPSRPYELAIVA